MICYFAEHPSAANILMLALVTLGLLSLPKLQRETISSFETNEVEVRVVYGGTSASKVEETICLRLEEATGGISFFLEERRCDARDGVAIMVLEKQEGQGEFARFLDDIKSDVDTIDDFPVGVE